MKVIDYVSDFLEQKEINDIKLSKECKEGSVASYNYQTKVLEVNEEKLISHADKLGLSIKDTVAIIISHELGHYLDEAIGDLFTKKQQVLNVIKNNFFTCDFESEINEGISYVIKAEKNAWALGERFVPNHLVSIYKEQIEATLISQANVTRNEIIEYIKLVMELEKHKK